MRMSVVLTSEEFNRFVEYLTHYVTQLCQTAYTVGLRDGELQ